MTDWQKARICWIPAAAGGRKQPPAGPRYSTVAKFNPEDDRNNWSIIIEFDQLSDDRGCIEGRIRFLVPEAPCHLLQPGHQFQLVEGARVVATVEILAATKFPANLNGIPQRTLMQREERVDDELQTLSRDADGRRP